MNLSNLPLVIIDIETTGGRYYNHRIIEIGAIKVQNGDVVDTFQTFVDPERSIPDPITRLTGINDSMVRGAPTFRNIADELREFLGDSIFTAHNARFDYGFIKQEFERLGEKYTAKVLCSVRLSRKLYPRFKRHNLSSIIERHGLSVENRHRALDDARAVWDFFTIIKDTIPADKQEAAIKQIIRKPSIPPRLKTDIEDIPERTGVYFFYGADDIPIYIGKAKNLRSRVLSHFSDTLRSNKEMTLAQKVTRITWEETHGELAALLLESYYIKKMLPLHNRRSRRTWQLTALKVDTSEEYHRAYYEGYKTILKEDLKDIRAIFKTRRDTVTFLESIAKAHRLCKPFLGIEKHYPDQKNCLNHQINKCNGACAGQEKAELHNLRLETALLSHQRISWPFESAILVEETNYNGTEGDAFVIDHWIVQEAFRYDENGQTPLFELDYTFDLDAFRILYRYLRKTKGLKITPVKSEQGVNG